MLYYTINKTKHNGRENDTFCLSRPYGTDDWLFLHFKTPVIFTISGIKYSIKSGTCILLSPKTPHEFRPDDCELIHDWMHFLPSNEDEFLNLKIDINTFFNPVDCNFITSTIKTCEYELFYKDSFYQDVISSEVSSMFINLKRQLTILKNNPHHYSNSFKELRLNIYRNPDIYQNSMQMALEMGLSRSRFSVIYKNIFGVSPQKDLISARISKASYLLSDSTLSLSEIAETCGYQNIFHFMRQFREIKGTTPSTYRKQQ